MISVNFSNIICFIISTIPVNNYVASSVVNGVRGNDADQYKGKVIKIVTSGIPPQSRHGTDMSKVDKMILCLRNPKHIAVSQVDLLNTQRGNKIIEFLRDEGLEGIKTEHFLSGAQC